MKNFKYITLILSLLVLVNSCNDVEGDNKYDRGAREGGLIEVQTRLINYVVGSTDPYDVSLLVYQGDVKSTKVDVYGTFYKKGSSGAFTPSNEVLVKSINVTESVTAPLNFDISFAELTNPEFKVNGSSLPTNDTEYKIGEYWELVYKVVNTDGTSTNVSTTKVAIATRFAGVYAMSLTYIHPTAGVLSDNEPGFTRIIESVDLTSQYQVYKATDIGSWEDASNFFYFYIDNVPNADGTFNITIPKEYNGATQLLWGADDIGTCQNGDLPSAACINLAKASDDGHDILQYSYGYIRSSGTRQFNEYMVKK